MVAHAEHTRGRHGPLLVAVADDVGQADRSLAEGADLIDASAAHPTARAAIQAAWPAHLWAGIPADLADADLAGTALAGTDLAGTPVGDAATAAAVAAAAIAAWLGAPAIRTRHVRAVRRAIDMTSSVSGYRPPALTVRGLA